ncbi:MAG: hypothetical protein ABSD21_02090 [Rhizomicrobium sp.]|jgi:hypothetical protein
MNSFITRDFDNGWMIPETCVSAKHLREALAIIDAINAGELLAALPASANDCHRHQTAVSLLALLERALRAALTEVPAQAHPCHAANKDTTPVPEQEP